MAINSRLKNTRSIFQFVHTQRANKHKIYKIMGIQTVSNIIDGLMLMKFSQKMNYIGRRVPMEHCV